MVHLPESIATIVQLKVPNDNTAQRTTKKRRYYKPDSFLLRLQETEKKLDSSVLLQHLLRYFIEVQHSSRFPIHSTFV
jgi:hypothetical protein